MATDFHQYRSGRLFPACRTCKRIQNREAAANRTAEQIELIREYQRFWAEAKRRMAGIPARNFNYSPDALRRRVTVIDRRERVFLEREPLLAEIARWLQENLPEWRRDPDRTVENLAGLAGLHGKTISRIQTGESRHVSLDVADKLAMALDVPLVLLYPDDNEEMAA